MPSLNNIQVMGHLGRDPEWKAVGDGLCSFSVATTESWKDKSGEWQENTTWFSVAVWGDKGKRLMDRLQKGDLVYVEGPHKSRKHEDKYFWTINAYKVLRLNKREDQPTRTAPAATVPDEDDGLPF